MGVQPLENAKEGVKGNFYTSIFGETQLGPQNERCGLIDQKKSTKQIRE